MIIVRRSRPEILANYLIGLVVALGPMDSETIHTFYQHQSSISDIVLSREMLGYK